MIYIQLTPLLGVDTHFPSHAAMTTINCILRWRMSHPLECFKFVKGEMILDIYKPQNPSLGT